MFASSGSTDNDVSCHSAKSVGFVTNTEQLIVQRIIHTVFNSSIAFHSTVFFMIEAAKMTLL